MDGIKETINEPKDSVIKIQWEQQRENKLAKKRKKGNRNTGIGMGERKTSHWNNWESKKEI